MPNHPRDLAHHDVLGFQPTGQTLSFDSDRGPVQVEVRPTLSSNAGHVLLAQAVAGIGIAILSAYVVLPSLRRGELVEILVDFPVPELWLKALVPDARMQVGRVGALVRFLAASFSPTPPWHDTGA